MLNADAQARQPPILGFVFGCQFRPARLFLGLDDSDSHDRKALKTEVLIQDTVGWKRIGFLVRHRFIVPCAFIRATEKVNAARVRNQQQVFQSMVFFLPAVVKPLFVDVYWAIDRAFSPIMKKKVGHLA